MSVLSRVESEHREDSHHVPVRGGPSSEPGVRPTAHFKLKDVVDPILAAIFLIPALPVIGLLVMLVRRTSEGPGIYRQVRVGKRGRRFTMYKIRTMRNDAESETGAVWTGADDPRVTPIGRFLRKCHLDELPQLFNVLKGDMYLIGPRPERPEFVEVLAERIPGYTDRLAVRPGVTGLAQINLPPDDSLASVCHKLTLDVDYIEKAGALLDTRMFLCTAVRLIGVPGEAATQLFLLNRHVSEPRYRIQAVNGDDPSVACRTPAELLARSGNGHARHGLEAGVAGKEKAASPGDSYRPRKPR